MDAREYLGQLRQLRAKIDNKRSQLEEKRYKSISIKSVSNNADRVQSSPSLDGGYKAIDAVVDLEREIERDIVAYQLIMYEVIDIINSIPNVKQMKVVYSKWVKDKSLEQIAVDEAYSFDHVRRLYWQGMKAVQKIIDRK